MEMYCEERAKSVQSYINRERPICEQPIKKKTLEHHRERGAENLLEVLGGGNKIVTCKLTKVGCESFPYTLLTKMTLQTSLAMISVIVGRAFRDTGRD